MINVHCTKKLHDALSLNDVNCVSPKLRPQMAEKLPQSGITPLNHWHGHYFVIQRSPCVFFIHDATRFPMFIPNIKKADLHNIDYYFQDALMNTIMKLGADEQLMENAYGLIHRLRFDTETNRSVQGTMNQMIKELKWNLSDVNVRDLLGYRQNVYISEWPCRVKGKKEAIFPKRDFMNLLKQF